MHFIKFAKGEAGHIIAHNERADIRAKLDNVDPTKSKLNYPVLSDDNFKSDYTRYKSILQSKNVRCMNRADVKTYCSFVITAPKNLPPEREQEFFICAAQFLFDRTNKAPCVSAWVHKDEPNAQPHLHYGFVPLVYDEKHSEKDLPIYKVCSNDIVDRNFLKTLHKDFDEYINAVMIDLPEHLEILNGSTAGGNKTIQELKNETLKKEIEKAETRLDNITKKYHEMKQKGNKKYEGIKKDIEQLEKIKKSLIDKIAQAENGIQDRKAEIKSLDSKISTLKKEYFTLENENFAPIFDKNQHER